MARLIDAKVYCMELYNEMNNPGRSDKCMRFALDLAIEALEKQIQKKPIEKYTDYDGTEAGLCPFYNEGVDENMNFCSYCGQAIDWSDDK